MSGHRGALVGVAALAIGVSLAGPQAAGTANADRGDANGGGASSAPARPGASRTAAAGPGRIAKPSARQSKVKVFLSQPTESAPASPHPVATASAAIGPLPRAGVLAWLAGGSDGGPAAAPLAWTALAVSRREIGGLSRGAAPAVTVSTSEPEAAQVAATAPASVVSITVPRNGTYGIGKTGKFTLNFDQAVEVTPGIAPILPIQVGFAMLNATYVSGSGTNKLVFQLTLTAPNQVGAITIGRVSNQLVGNDKTPVRIFDFNGLGHAIGPTDTVTTPRIVNAGTNIAVSDTIPTVDTSKIFVDTRGPAVSSYSAVTNQNGPLGITHWTTVTVNFDQAVMVKGTPTIPVTIGGVNDVLTYSTGSGTNRLTFTKFTAGAAPGEADFSTEGQIIDLPTGATITDKLGNSVAVVLGNFKQEPGTLGDPLVVDGNQIVVLDNYYQHLGTITADQLNTVLGAKAVDAFYYEGAADLWTPTPIDKPLTDPASWWAGYTPPDFEKLGPVVNAVDLYRVAYNSTIPEQNNRATLAYGLVAVPQGATGPLPVVSYQHGAVIDKGTVPSQSFNWLLNPVGPEDKDENPAYADHLASYETRLNVAQFAGRGYAVMAADYFGVGNSLENDGYISKPSQQQACFDMYEATKKLLTEQEHEISNLFLGGWSQGGLVTLDFLEKLQSEGIAVTGAGTAAAPGNVQLTSNAWYFNPRLYTGPKQLTTPDDVYLSAVGTLSNFSITGYAGYTASPLEMLGVNYEAARALYMREFDDLLYTPPARNSWNFTVIRDGLAEAKLPYNMQLLIAPQYSGVANELAFAQTNYAQLLASSGAGQIYLNSPLQMWYGLQDQAIPTPAGMAVYEWQTNSFGNTQITAVPVTAGNHRGTFLVAVHDELAYFKDLLQKAPESL